MIVSICYPRSRPPRSGIRLAECDRLSFELRRRTSARLPQGVVFAGGWTLGRSQAVCTDNTLNADVGSRRARPNWWTAR